MNSVRQHFLASAGLAQQQHSGVLLRGTPRLPLDFQAGRTVTDEARQRVPRTPILDQLALRVGQFQLHPCKLGDQRLQVMQPAVQHETDRPDHLAGGVL